MHEDLQALIAAVDADMEARVGMSPAMSRRFARLKQALSYPYSEEFAGDIQTLIRNGVTIRSMDDLPEDIRLAVILAERHHGIADE